MKHLELRKYIVDVLPSTFYSALHWLPFSSNGALAMR